MPECPKCQGEMWDNRSRKTNPRAPDFKCKDQSCDGVIWPPKGAKQSAPARRGGGGGGAYQKSKSPEEQARIERQHSQEMALRYFAMEKATTPPETKRLRGIIDWFQRDIGHSPVKDAPEPQYADRVTPEGHPEEMPQDDETTILSPHEYKQWRQERHDTGAGKAGDTNAA